MPLAVYNELLPLNNQVRFTSADTTVAKSLMTQSGFPSRLDTILITNTDTIDHKIRFYWNWASVNYLMGSVDVPAGQGTLGTPAIEALALLFPAGSQGFAGTSGWNLQAAMEVTVVATFAVDIVLFGGNL